MIGRLLDAGEPLILVYILVIAAGCFGFVDILQYGDYVINAEGSLFARIQWPVIYALTLMLIARRWDRFGHDLELAWPMMLWALLAVASLAWSVDRVATFNGAGRFLFTMLIGMVLGTRLDMRRLMVMVFAVLAGSITLSVLLFAAHVPFAVAPEGVARGLFFHKNMLGGRAAMLVLLSVDLLIAGWRRLLAFGGLMVGVVAIVLSHSATSAVTALLLIGATPFLAAFRARRVATTALLLALGLLLVGVVAFAFAYTDTNPMTLALAELDRDPTLTGRADLWQAGLSQFRDHPWLGYGYAAFWTAGADWRTTLVLNDLGDVGSFHDTAIEILVQVGAVGLILVVATLLGLVAQALRLLIRTGDALLIWPLGFLLLAVINGLTEITIFTKHSLPQLLLTALQVQMAAMSRPAPSAAAAPRTPQPSPTIPPVRA